MKNLSAYKATIADLEFATSHVKQLDANRDKKPIVVSASVKLDAFSSEKQFLYAMSIANQRITSCADLDTSAREHEELKASIIHMYKLSREIEEWSDYRLSIQKYSKAMYELLSAEEKLQLLKDELPDRPSVR